MNTVIILDRDEIRRRRIARGLSVNELARRAGVSGAAISYIENGKRAEPRASTMAKIVAILEPEKCA